MKKVSESQRNTLREKAKLVRKWCLLSTTEAGSGHPTSCLSAADLMTVLFDRYFRYDTKNPSFYNNDRLIFSTGHAAPLLYTLYALSGAFEVEKLRTLRKFNSPLEGHPTPEFVHFNAATGSLGQGLSIGCGMALAAKKDALLFKTYVLLGDGELAEGQVWEAANFASYYKLNNLIAIADINRFGQSQETMFGHHVKEYEKRFAAFGWEVIAIDGHDMQQIVDAFEKAIHTTSKKPVIIIGKTYKGGGISFLQDKDGSHGKALKKEELEKALAELGEIDDSLRFNLSARGPVKSVPPTSAPLVSLRSNASARVGSPSSFATPRYKIGEEIATREAYGKTLVAFKSKAVFAFDAEVKNSTFSQDYLKAYPDQFIECFIAEQNMVGVALGFARLGKIAFVSSFAAFLSRAFDQIRMSRLSNANLKFVGSHAGVSIGEDGGSQMALEDFALFGAIPNSILFHPCDAVSTAALVSIMARQKGVSYLRTLRPKTPVIYNADEQFSIGGSKTLKSSKNDSMTIAACGITVFEALKAHEALRKQGISVRVIDCYSIKPIDEAALRKSILSTQKSIIISIEDHYTHGGLGDFVLNAINGTHGRVEKMCVGKIPHSGTKDELLAYEQINAPSIIKRVKSLV